MPKQAAILAIDQGTTSSRAMIFDDQARVVALAQQEFPQIYPADGWVALVEDPIDWKWSSARWYEGEQGPGMPVIDPLPL